MKRFRAVALVVLVIGLLVGPRIWHALQSSSSVVIPFQQGLASSAPSGDVFLFVRQADGTYTNLEFGITGIHTFLSSMSALNQILNTGLKTLAAGQPAPAGVGTQSQTMALADLDGNGSIGAALAGGSIVAVYQGTLGLSFHSQVNYNVGQDVNSVVFADFNGDGKPDMAAGFDGGGVAVLLNKGDGTFAAAKTFASGNPVTNFAVLDLNHDNKLDIAAVTLNQTVLVMLGDGKGNFGEASSFSVGGSGEGIAIGDFNGDNNPDIVAGTILLGNGTGGFTPGPALPSAAASSWTYAIGDLDGDGIMDLVYADIDNQVVVPMFGKGDGSFTPSQGFAVDQLPNSLLLADYNHDGHLDIVNGTGDQRFFVRSMNSRYMDVIYNNGNRTFQGAPTYFTPDNNNLGSLPLSMAAGNFGGTPGVLVDGRTGSLYLFHSDSKGALQSPQTVTIPGQGPSAVVSGDFNGDGNADAAAALNTGSVAILISGTTGFAPATTVPTGLSSVAALVSGDFDGDNKIDLAVIGTGQSSSSGTLSFLKGKGDGTFAAPVAIQAGVSPTSLIAADLNGDKMPDLLFTDNGSGGQGAGVFVALNHGSGAFGAPVNAYPSSFPVATAADVDGDGKPDLIASTELGNGQTTLNFLHGKGDGSFGSAVVLATTDGTVNAVLVGDFDGDQHPDIVVAHQTSDATYLQGNGDGTFSAEAHLLSTYEPTFLASTDLNGDGKPDVVIGGFTVTTLINNSIQVMTTTNSATFLATPVASGSIVTGFGADLATAPVPSSGSLTTQLGGTTVTLTDSAGTAQQCLLFYVAPLQINFLIPPNAASGLATVSVHSGDGTVTPGTVSIVPVAPGIYPAGGTSLAAGFEVRADAAGNQSRVPLVSFNSSNQFVTLPINLDPPTDTVFLELYGTGIRNSTLSQVSMSANGTALPAPTYAGAAPGFTGEDQIDVQLPHPLKGSGDTAITLTIAGQASNTVHIQIQ